MNPRMRRSLALVAAGFTGLCNAYLPDTVQLASMVAAGLLTYQLTRLL